MFLHADPFVIIKLGAFVEHVLGRDHLANIVQQAARGQGQQIITADANGVAKYGKVGGDPQRMNISVVMMAAHVVENAMKLLIVYGFNQRLAAFGGGFKIQRLISFNGL